MLLIAHRRAPRGRIIRLSAWMGLLLAMLLSILAWPHTGRAAERAPDVELRGEVRDRDSGANLDLPFTVPADVAAVRVVVDYPRTAKGAILTLGVDDPQRFRGWGGGIKTDFTIAESFATPSFNPGPIPAGVWRLKVGVAFAAPGSVTPYHAKIYFSRRQDLEHVAFANAPLKDQPGWYRGDLHTHTGDSDGACRSLGGKSAPCPAVFTLQAAVAHGLDFVAVTDHNVTAHFAALGEMQAYFDTLLILPGREITTRLGHANLIGPMGDLDLEVGPPGAETMNALLARANATGGFLSINHPALASGEDCLGCGWTADTDYARVQGIEAVNGGTIAETPGDHEAAVAFHIAFWEDKLNRGYRLTGVGGSDNHDARQELALGSPIGPQSPVGYPTTVVYAESLSQKAILDGLKSGRVFIDLGQGRGRVLDLNAKLGAASAVMGGVLAAPARAKGGLAGEAHVVGARGGRVELIVDGLARSLPNPALTRDDQTLSFVLPDVSRARWLRINVRDAAGHLLMVGNPIYLDHDAR